MAENLDNRIKRAQTEGADALDKAKKLRVELNDLTKQEESLATKISAKHKHSLDTVRKRKAEVESELKTVKEIVKEEKARIENLKRYKAILEDTGNEARDFNKEYKELHPFVREQLEAEKTKGELYKELNLSAAQYHGLAEHGEGEIADAAKYKLKIYDEINESLAEQAKETAKAKAVGLFGKSELAVQMEYIKNNDKLSKQDKHRLLEALELKEKLIHKEEIYKEFQEESSEIMNELPEDLNKAIKGMGKLVNVAKGMAPALIALSLVAFAVEGFLELEAAAEDFRKTTGYTRNQTYEIEHAAHEIALEYRKFGVTAEHVYDVVNELKNEFSDITQFSEATTAALSVMTNNLGLGASNGAKVQAVFEEVGGLSQEAAANVGLQVAKMSELAGVSPKEVLEDIANSAEITSKYFRGDINLLKSQVIQAHQLGQTLEEVEKTTARLLDFENSIEDELVAATFVGGQFNLSQARGLAAAGKMVDAQSEILNQIQRSGEFSKQDVFTQQQLAKAAGMTIPEINKQLKIREKLGHLSGEELENAKKAIEGGLDLSEVNEKELNHAVEQFAQQTKINGKVTEMGNAFKGMVETLGSIMLPIITKLASLFEFLSQNTKTFGALLGAAGGWAAYLLYQNRMAVIEKGKELVMQKAILEHQYAQIGAKIESNALDVQTAATQNLITTEKVAQTGQEQMGFFAKLRNLFVDRQSAKANLQGAVASIWKSFTSILGPLAIIGIGAAIGGLFASFSKAGDISSPAGDGKTRVSTKEGGLFELSPNDDLIAAPGAASAMAGGGGTSGGINLAALSAPLNSMISEIKALRNDMASGKIAVYMDGALVTAGVTKQVEKTSRNSFNLK